MLEDPAAASFMGSAGVSQDGIMLRQQHFGVPTEIVLKHSTSFECGD